jgi:hypothetical protein
LIKTKTNLLQKKDDFGRKGNNWIEPLKNWILTANYAEKLALSNDFDEIKSFVEKIGTNRRLLDKKIFFDFVRPFDLIPKYKEICEASRAEGEASEQLNSSKNDESCIWSGRADLNGRPPAPKAGALTRLRHAPTEEIIAGTSRGYKIRPEKTPKGGQMALASLRCKEGKDF